MSGNKSTVTETLQLSDLIKLVRILRLGRIIRFTRTRDDVKATMKLLQLTLYLIMWVHLTGCIWFLIIRDDEEWVPVPDFLTGTTEVYESGIWLQYFTSFYHAVWLLTGGEVGPRTTLQTFVASMLFLIGALITAVLFGEMAVLMSNLSRRQTIFQETLDGALTTMNNMRLPEDLTNRILDYITSTQSSISAQKEYKTFQDYISPSLQQQVSACIYDPIISKNEVLQSESDLTKVLVHKLINKFTNPEKEIIKETSEAKKLCFLVNGECVVQVTDKDEAKHNVCYLYPGAHFGEIGLIYSTQCTATVVGLGYCTIAKLQKKYFDQLSRNFPTFIEKLKAWTNVYRDPWKEFLVQLLLQASYISSMPEEVYYELVYNMEITKIEKGQYLFKPGEPNNKIFLITDGLLELASTFNEKHLHLLKKHEGIPDIEEDPKIPKRQTVLSDYKDFHFNLLYADRLKARADVVPIQNEQGIVGSIGLGEETPEHTTFIGDYPQEIVLEELGQGTLLYPHIALMKQNHQFQARAIKTTTVYALSMDLIEDRAYKHRDLADDISQIRSELEEQHIYLDYCILNESRQQKVRRLFRDIIIRRVMAKREERRNGSQIAQMVPKLKAVIACEEAMNFELAEKVMKGEIPPHYILEDGSLDPAAMTTDFNAALPKSHPIMKAFKMIFDSVNTPDGNIKKQYLNLEKMLERQNHDMDVMIAEMQEYRVKLDNISYMSAKGIPEMPKPKMQLPPISRSPQPVEIPRLDIDKVNEITENRRKRRERRKQKQEPKSESADLSQSVDLLSFIKNKK